LIQRERQQHAAELEAVQNQLAELRDQISQMGGKGEGTSKAPEGNGKEKAPEK
jgi:hypothetical protein